MWGVGEGRRERLASWEGYLDEEVLDINDLVSDQGLKEHAHQPN